MTFRLFISLSTLAIVLSTFIYLKPHPASNATVIAASGDVNLAKQLAAWKCLVTQTQSGKALEAALARVGQSGAKPEEWCMLGDLFAQLQRESGETKRHDDAEIAYQHALYLRPDSVDALTGMAWVTGGRHDFPTSIQWAQKALAVDEHNPTAYGILGDAALELGEYDDAYEHYQKMIDLKPDLSSWSRGAYLLWLTGDKSKAMALMTKAINAGGPYAENTAWCRAKLATMLFLDGAYLPAETTLQPCLAAGSTHPHVLSIAAKLAATRLDYTQAETYYDTMLKAGPSLEALAGKGDLLAAQGKPKEAEPFYNQVQELHATNVRKGVHDHAFMAKFYTDHDRNLAEALRMAEEHKSSKNVIELDTLAWAYFKNGQLAKAVAATKKALAHKTPDPVLHYHAACVAEVFGDLNSAKKHLELALQMSPKFDLLQAAMAEKRLSELMEKPTSVPGVVKSS
jgi:tetratricopeptide (TPR) repeat protein